MTSMGAEVLFAVSVASSLLMVALAVWSGVMLRKEIRVQQVAEQRAKALLDELLTEEEQGQLAQTGYLAVQSAQGRSRTYYVPRSGGVVDVYEDGGLALRLCLQPAEWLPSADVVVVHKLMIEGDEQEYLRRANVQWLRAGARVYNESPRAGWRLPTG